MIRKLDRKRADEIAGLRSRLESVETELAQTRKLRAVALNDIERLSDQVRAQAEREMALVIAFTALIGKMDEVIARLDRLLESPDRLNGA